MEKSFFKKIINKIEKKGSPTENEEKVQPTPLESDENIKSKEGTPSNEEIEKGAKRAVENLLQRIRKDFGGERDKTQL